MKKYPKRKQIRLKNFDYSQPGYYYVTICTYGRQELFGEIVTDKMVLNKNGQIIKECLENISNNFKDIELDIYCIMPNHVHATIQICRGLIHQTRDKSINKLQNNIDNCNTDQNIAGMINHAPTNWICMTHNKTTLGKIVRYFKARASKIIHNFNEDNFKWQRLFYDRIIDNKKTLDNIRKYIKNNPATWDNDEHNPNNRNHNQSLQQTVTRTRLMSVNGRLFD